MAIDDKHPQHTKQAGKVSKVRAFVEGGEAVKGYIDKLPGHDETIFELYKARAYYLPAVSRTLDAFVGMIMNPAPVIENEPPGLEEYRKDVTFNGETFARVAQSIVEELVTTPGCFVLVDYPAVAEENITKAQAKARGLRAYARIYPFESVHFWRTETRGGEKYLSHVRLFETITEVDPKDEFEETTVEQYRVLDVTEDGYRVRIFREDDNGKWFQFNEVYPKRDGAPLEEIPGVFFRPGNLDPDRSSAPPLDELVDLSCSHLNDSADRQHALAWCGSPTLVLTGLKADDTAVKLGASEGIVLGEGGSAEILSLGAEGVGAIRQSMEDKRRDMATIGARILSDQTSSNVATETMRTERIGEHSILAAIANTVADGLTRVLKYLAGWEGVAADNLVVTLNTDYVPTGLQPGELTEWIAAVQSGLMPISVFLARLKSKGVISPDLSQEDFDDELEKDRENLMTSDLDDEDDDQDDDEDDDSSAKDS